MSANTEATITNTDLKNPKKVGIKILKMLINGAGGMLQEGIGTSLSKMVPNEKMQPLISGAQWLGAGVINGYIDNEYIESLLGGVSAGAAKDIAEKLKTYFTSKMSPKLVDTASATRLATAVSNTNEDFF